MAKLRDVAERAGVGVGTASRAMSGRGYVEAETRQRIMAAADELGYRPNSVARALRESKTRVVGLLLPDLANEFYTESAAMLQHVLAEADFDLIVSASGNDPAVEARGLQSLLDRRVDGIIHVPVNPQAAVPKSVPVVQLNRHSMPLQVDAFVADDAFGIGELTRLALEAGHADIAFIGGAPVHSTSAERLNAFRSGVLAAGLVENSTSAPRFRILAGEFTSQWGRDALHSLHADPPTVIVAASSRIALGVLHACRDLQISVSAQLSLVAHGNPEWYEAFSPAITCYAPPLAEIGRAAATAILNHIGEPTDRLRTTAPTVTKLHGDIRIRGSLVEPLR
ncbi:hypothetical protein B1790_10535 [Mycobacterium sp. AT1]|nr:hypothetical protein B1790_10535 [Mycobacterium sp. AT1]